MSMTMFETSPDPIPSQANPTRRRGPMILLAAVIALATFVGAGALWFRARTDPGIPVAGVSTIAVRDNAFGPAAVAVPAGTEVTWLWEGEEEHNVVGDGFASPVQADGELAHAFTEPGVYGYQCTLHFLMRGEVVVNG